MITAVPGMLIPLPPIPHTAYLSRSNETRRSHQDTTHVTRDVRHLGCRRKEDAEGPRERKGHSRVRFVR